MKKAMIVSFVAFTMLACKGKQENKGDATPKDMETVQTPEPVTAGLERGCYSYDGNGSAVLLEITRTGNPIVGNLTYAFSGKDRNTGEFKGALKDDKLIGTYTFASEGKEGTREVAFQVKGDQLVEGYGELTDGGTAFKDRDAISYSSTMPLTKTDCDK
ncbi:hypothetical protein [Pricia sp.]|uniref:hypothetical protein n=1 Tax=Pricia sp. TaxID=2268138 RepID=UPI003592F741